MVTILDRGPSLGGQLGKALGQGIGQGVQAYGQMQLQDKVDQFKQLEVEHKRITDINKNASKYTREYFKDHPDRKLHPANETKFQRMLSDKLAQNPNMIVAEAGDEVFIDLVRQKAKEQQQTGKKGEPITKDSLWQQIFMGTPTSEQQLSQDLGLEEPKGFLDTVIDRYQQQVAPIKRKAEAFALGTTATPGIPRDLISASDMVLEKFGEKAGLSEGVLESIKAAIPHYNALKNTMGRLPSGQEFQEAFKETQGIDFESQPGAERIFEAGGAGISGGPLGIVIGASGQAAIEAGVPEEYVPLIQIATAIVAHKTGRAGKKFDAGEFGKKAAKQIEFKPLSEGSVAAGEKLQTNMGRLKVQTGESGDQVFTRVAKEAEKRGIDPSKVASGDEAAIGEMNKLVDDLIDQSQAKKQTAKQKQQQQTKQTSKAQPSEEQPTSPQPDQGAGMDIFGEERPLEPLKKTAAKVKTVPKPVALKPEGLKKSPEKRAGKDFFAAEVENLAETPIEEHAQERSIKHSGLEEREAEFRPAIKENTQEITNLRKEAKLTKDTSRRDDIGKKLERLERENYELSHAIKYGKRPLSAESLKPVVEKGMQDYVNNFLNPTPESIKRFETSAKRLNTLVERVSNELKKGRLPESLAQDYFITIHDAYAKGYSDIVEQMKKAMKDPDSLLYDSKEGKALVKDAEKN